MIQITVLVAIFFRIWMMLLHSMDAGRETLRGQHKHGGEWKWRRTYTLITLLYITALYFCHKLIWIFVQMFWTKGENYELELLICQRWRTGHFIWTIYPLKMTENVFYPEMYIYHTALLHFKQICFFIIFFSSDHHHLI